MLTPNQPAHGTKRELMDLQCRAIALRPDQTLRPCQHQSTMLAYDLSLRVDVEQRVVAGGATVLRVASLIPMTTVMRARCAMRQSLSVVSLGILTALANKCLYSSFNNGS